MGQFKIRFRGTTPAAACTKCPTPGWKLCEAQGREWPRTLWCLPRNLLFVDQRNFHQTNLQKSQSMIVTFGGSDCSRKSQKLRVSTKGAFAPLDISPYWTYQMWSCIRSQCPNLFQPKQECIHSFPSEPLAATRLSTVSLQILYLVSKELLWG